MEENLINYRVTIEYNGEHFCGFQYQPNCRTVEGEIEKVLTEILGKETKIYASGRTDSGVHALGQVGNFFCTEPNKQKLLHQINDKLPEDVKLLNIVEVPAEFDSRFSAKKKTYGYRFYLSRYERPLFESFALRVNDNVDVKKMADSAGEFVGEYDFTSFVARKSGKTNFVRKIYDARINCLDKNQQLYEFEITANGFLYNMVRIIFGTLLDVGYSRKQKEDIKKIILAKDRTKAGKTMPAKGLVLKSVCYEN